MLGGYMLVLHQSTVSIYILYITFLIRKEQFGLVSSPCIKNIKNNYKIGLLENLDGCMDS